MSCEWKALGTHESVDESGGHATVEGKEEGEVVLAAQTQRK